MHFMILMLVPQQEQGSTTVPVSVDGVATGAGELREEEEEMEM